MITHTSSSAFNFAASLTRASLYRPGDARTYRNLGAVYAFMVSFSDLPVALFLAGQGFVTFPVAIFQSLDYDFSPSMLALSTLIIVFSFVVMVVVQRSIGLTNMLHTGGAG